MYGYDLYHAYLILIEIQQENTSEWAAIAYLYYCLKMCFVLFYVEGKRFKLDIRVIHVRDLNFVL